MWTDFYQNYKGQPLQLSVRAYVDLNKGEEETEPSISLATRSTDGDEKPLQVIFDLGYQET